MSQVSIKSKIQELPNDENVALDDIVNRMVSLASEKRWVDRDGDFFPSLLPNFTKIIQTSGRWLLIGDIAKLLLTTITQSASEAATLDITKQLGNITSGLTSGLTNGLKGNAAGQLKGLLGN